MGMPDSFRLESDRRRREAADALRARAAECDRADAETWPVEFPADDRDRAAFERAARVATLLDEQYQCSVSNLTHVRFRPYPSKRTDAWRVEVNFASGSYSGKEWYVSGAALWDAWESCACG